jgi:hypothetical protein
MSNDYAAQKAAKARNDRASRVLWTFLFSTLLGPAIAAALLAAIYLISGTLGKGPPSLTALKPGELLPYVAQRTLDGYVWSAIPAALAGLALAALVYSRGTFHWLAGVVAAAVAASLVAVLSGGQAANHVSFIALIAAVTAVLGRFGMTAAKIVD